VIWQYPYLSLRPSHGVPRDRAFALTHGDPCVVGVECNEGGVMAKRFGRPSLQYRYEHYDPSSGRPSTLLQT
jgi:hypothetical protein